MKKAEKRSSVRRKQIQLRESRVRRKKLQLREMLGKSRNIVFFNDLWVAWVEK